MTCLNSVIEQLPHIPEVKVIIEQIALIQLSSLRIGEDLTVSFDGNSQVTRGELWELSGRLFDIDSDK